MGSITGLTALRMAEIEDASIVSGAVVGDNLFLERHDGTTINAGNVRGPQGEPGTGGGGGGGGDASGSYTPSNPSHWPTDPNTIQQALDFLAEFAHNISQYNYVVLIAHDADVPEWVRTDPETVVMRRPPA